MNTSDKIKIFRKIVESRVTDRDDFYYTGQKNCRDICKLYENPPKNPSEELEAWINISKKVIAYQDRLLKGKTDYYICSTADRLRNVIKLLCGDSIQIEDCADTPSEFFINDKMVSSIIYDDDYSIQIRLGRQLKIEQVCKVNGKIVSSYSLIKKKGTLISL